MSNNVDNTKELPAVLSLCTGYGGIERGLELAGFRHRIVAHVEIEAFAGANLVAKMEEGKLAPSPIWTNLKTLPVEPFRDRVDLITGGYPCQPFSAAGQRKGKDDPRHLWPYIFDIIKAIRPIRCFFENVEGHISLGLREVISDLESLGYQTTFGIFSAAEVGAPHQRKRVYILADSGNRNTNGLNDIEKREFQKGQDSQPSGVCTNVADTDDSGNRTSKCRDMSEDGTQVHEGQDRDAQSGPSRCGEELADTSGKGLQRRGITRNISGKESEPDDQFAPRCNSAQIGKWEPEPRVGRVVDGCADRVDRIRLLGNGVVPQTAALAWITLISQLEKESDE
jgi:DNA (cytosine-5)-methyltransferase 1